MAALYFADASLFRILCLGLSPAAHMRVRPLERRGDHGGFGLAGQGFDPRGVAVNLVHTHLIFVASAGGLRKLASLV